MIISLVMPVAPAEFARHLTYLGRLAAAPHEGGAEQREHRVDAEQHELTDSQWQLDEPTSGFEPRLPAPGIKPQPDRP
jgi:hypothetical protein